MASSLPQPWRRLAPPLFVVLLALTVRIAFQRNAEAYPRLELIRNALDDQVLYDLWARSILAGVPVDWAATGHEFAYWARRWPGVFAQDPLYAYALAGFFRVFGFAYDGVRALQAAMGAATALLVWALARRHVSPGAALACGGIAALYQPLVFYEATLLREPLATFLVAGALLAVSAAASGSRRTRAVFAAGAGGTLLGLAVVTRSHLMLPAAALGVWLLLATRRLGVAPAVCLAAAAAMPVAPVVAVNVARSGHPAFVSSAGPYNLFVGNVHDTAGGPSPRYFEVKAQGPPESVDLLAALREEVARHPWTFMRLQTEKAASLLGTREAPDNLNVAMGGSVDPALRMAAVTDALLMPLALLGAALGLTRCRRHAALYTFVLAYAASVVPFIVVSRLRQPLLPALAVFVGIAADRIHEWVASGRRMQAAGLAAAALLGAVAMSPHHPPIRNTDYLMAAAAYARLGELREAAGDDSGALRAYGRAVALNPEHMAAVTGAVRARAALGTPPLDTEAADLCAQARSAAQAGRYDEALRLLDEAAERAPEWAVPYHYRVNVQLLRGDAAAALADQERAVALDPGDALQRENLKALRRTIRAR